MSSATKTTDHDVIRHWVEERHGRPARVNAPGHKQGGGILRIDFDDPGGEKRTEALEEIGWDEFSKPSRKMIWPSSTRIGAPTERSAGSTSSSAAPATRTDRSGHLSWGMSATGAAREFGPDRQNAGVSAKSFGVRGGPATPDGNFSTQNQ